MPTNTPLRQLLAKLSARRTFAHNIEIVTECQSTNDELKKRIAAGIDVSSTLLIAHHQQSGRGRSARDWWSGAAGDNLCFSLGLTCTDIAPHVVGLIGAVALAEVCSDLFHAPNKLAIKWPNDILLNDAKLAGFLCELPAGGNTLILGLGVNVNSKPSEAEAGYATACINEGGLDFTPTKLLALWLHRFEAAMLRFSRAGSDDFEERFLHYLQCWAPNGVRNPSNQKVGALLKFSVANGLTLDVDGETFTQTMEAIHCLEKINYDT
ncbi:MAG: biotin-[acetyl-CoA-carboxylase] ligase BirA-like protein [Myxococcota bacterium]|jgi:biotin-[acetyl-CoA-carboxylase] ligase BirA-like protein